VERSTSRCCHVVTVDEPTGRNGEVLRRSTRCANLSMPMGNHCVEHVLYNVNQKLYSYCSRPCCGRPVSPGDTILFEGLCRQHYKESAAMENHPTTAKVTSNPPRGSAVVQCSTYQPSQAVKRKRTAEQYAARPAAPVDTHMHPEGVHENESIVEGDVSLASVAKDLGIEGRELTDMLARLPVEDPLDNSEGEDGDNFFGVFSGDMKADDDVSGIDLGDLGHSWADVESFLLSEGYHVDTPSPVNSSSEVSATPGYNGESQDIQ
jgi:hypothetical protein